jgi:hypothetical protein
MGCDIHVFLEFRSTKYPNAGWDSFTWHPINPGRNYEFFAKLSGVRGMAKEDPVASPGWPQQISWAAREWNTKRINKPDGALDPARISTEQAEKWVKGSSSQYIYDEDGNVIAVTHPDWHSHGYCSLETLTKTIRGNSSSVWRAIIAAAKSLKKDGYEVRFLFAYDN